MGQEGNYGIVTDAVIRIRPIPSVKKYGSIIFPDFECGIKFMEAMSKQRQWPASLRLIDNTQFQFGYSLKPLEHNRIKEIIDGIKKFLLVNIKGFDPEKMTVCTIVYEGSKEDVSM